MTTRQRVPTAIILVGSAFAAIGIALACGAIFVLRYRSGASTMLMVLVLANVVALAAIPAWAMLADRNWSLDHLLQAKQKIF